MIDPETLGEARRADWQARATDQRMPSLRARSAYERVEARWEAEREEMEASLIRKD